MSTMKNLAMVALAAAMASPLPAQVVASTGTVRDRVEAARRRAEEARTRAVLDSALLRTRGTRESARRIPPGHLPPRGLCRVWIEGVPPGQQPPVESCAAAQTRAATTANAHVIYGDRESFPGKGKGKFKNRDAESRRDCIVQDGVVVGGTVIPVCRDDRTQRDRRASGRFEDDDDRFDDEDSDRRFAKQSKWERKAGKAARKGKHGRG